LYSIYSILSIRGVFHCGQLSGTAFKTLPRIMELSLFQTDRMCPLESRWQCLCPCVKGDCPTWECMRTGLRALRTSNGSI